MANTHSSGAQGGAVSYRAEMEAHARDYLEQVLDEPFTLGAALRGDEGWYLVPAESDTFGGFTVYVHLDKQGPQVRDDRVLAGLDRQTEGLLAEVLPPEAVCAACLSFANAAPARQWYTTEELAAVQQGDALYAMVYLALPEAQAHRLPAALADAAGTLAGAGLYATLTGGTMPDDALEAARAEKPAEADLDKAMTARILWAADPADGLTREERLARIEEKWKEAHPA